jgi:parallel beta-helix repeat protein
MKRARWSVTLLLTLCGLFAKPKVATATDISGEIDSTLTITENSKLVGDVLCTVTGGSCISFGASGIGLKLGGFTMTGLGARDSCPSSDEAGHGIDDGGQANVSIDGPGLIRGFQGDGILLTGTTNHVFAVVVASSCANGIEIQGSGNSVFRVTVVRASLAGVFDAGILVQGDGRNYVSHSVIVDASNLTAPGGHGVVILSSNNSLYQNNVSGNPGAGIFILDGATGNTITSNSAFGNRIYHDIFDDNAPGSNSFVNNSCELSGGNNAPACPAVGPPPPN